jgi:ABC-2 type transport system permease protein
MRKLKSLVLAMLKNTFSMVDQGKRKKSSKILLYGFSLLMIVAFLPTLAMLHFLTIDAVDLLAPFQQTGVIVALLFNALALMIFFFGIFLIPAVFYFSRDIETLLALPLKPVDILLSKFVVTLIYEYLTLALFFIPVISGYARAVSPDLLFYVYAFIVFLILPIIPLVLAGLIIMLIMWLIPFAKNRDFFNMISGGIALIFALWLNYALAGLATVTEGDLINMLIEGNNSLIALFQSFIPNIPFAIAAVVNSDFVQLLIALAITAAIFAGFLLLSQILYFRGVIGVNETSSSRRQLSSKDFSKSTRSQKAIVTYLLKELRLLFRTPIYMMNCVSINVLLPVLFIVMTAAFPEEEDLFALILSIPWDNVLAISLASAFGVAFGLVMGSMNMVSATAISREGQHVYFMKMIPMEIMDQLHAKSLSGFLLSLLGLILTVIPAAYFLKAPWYILAIFSVMAILGSLFINYLSIIVDVIHPKLVWETEQAAVKQNINFIFTMLPSFGLAYLLVWLALTFDFDYRIFAPASFLVMVALTLITIKAAQMVAHVRFDEIS